MQKHDGINVKTALLLGALFFACLSLSKTSGAPANTSCQLPKVVGPCRAAIPRFYFNSQSGKCEQFTYGGCDGNANNFKSEEECNQACHSA